MKTTPTMAKIEDDHPMMKKRVNLVEFGNTTG
jgi:hypothetical protein